MPAQLKSVTKKAPGKVAIEKDVPVPERRSQYPLSELGVGDSFYHDGLPYLLRSAADHYAKKTGRRFIVRKEGEGSRVWRIE